MKAGGQKLTIIDTGLANSTGNVAKFGIPTLVMRMRKRGRDCFWVMRELVVGRMGTVLDRDGRHIGVIGGCGGRSRGSGGTGGSRVGIGRRGDRRIRGRLEGNNKVIEIHRICVWIFLLVVEHHVLVPVTVGGSGSVTQLSDTRAVVVVVRGKKAMLLFLLTFQTHGHHTPGQVFHAFLVGELGLCAGIETPDLGGQRIPPLLGFQLIGTIPVGEK